MENKTFDSALGIYDEKYCSKNKLVLHIGQMRMFIYCDIIEKQFVGDTMAPLLRSFFYIGHKHGEPVTKSFDHLQYLDLKLPEFEMIHVYIRNEIGEPVLFESGSLSITLHFRRKRPYY